MEYVDYDRGAGDYDQVRRGFLQLDHEAQEQYTDIILSAIRPDGEWHFLEPAVGTGRVALPLARRGLRVWCLDRSERMLEELRSKPDSRLLQAICRADIRDLPFRARQFDAVMVAAVLYLVPDWQAAVEEAVRVLGRPGWLLHHWGNGLPHYVWCRIRDMLRSLLHSHGVSRPFHPGARTHEEVHRFIMSLGFEHVPLDMWRVVRVEVPSRHLQNIVEGKYSYTWHLPDGVLSRVMPLLREQCVQEFGDLDEPIEQKEEFGWDAYRTL